MSPFKDLLLLTIRFYLTYALAIILFPHIGVDLSTIIPESGVFQPLTFLEQLAPAVVLLMMSIGIMTRAAALAVIGLVGYSLFYTKFGINISDLESPLILSLLSGLILTDGAGRVSIDSKLNSLFSRSK